MRELALNLQVAIATQGLVWLNKENSDTTEKAAKYKFPQSNTLTRSSGEVRSSGVTCDTSAATDAVETCKDANETSNPDVSHISSSNSTAEKCQRTSESEFGKAMQELSDPMIAVKGHALIQLTKLIRRLVW